MRKLITILAFMLLINMWAFFDLEKVFGAEITYTIDWQLVSDGEMTQIQVPNEALNIVSAKIRWKGYTYNQTISDSATNYSQWFEYDNKRDGPTGDGVFPQPPEGAYNIYKYISLRINRLEGKTSEKRWKMLYKVDEGSSAWYPYRSGNPVLLTKSVARTNTDAFDISGIFANSQTPEHVEIRHELKTTWEIDRDFNSLNSKVSINGIETSCPIPNLADSTISEWVNLNNFNLGTNNLIHSITGGSYNSNKVYYQVEYTYRINDKPKVNINNPINGDWMK